MSIAYQLVCDACGRRCREHLGDGREAARTISTIRLGAAGGWVCKKRQGTLVDLCPACVAAEDAAKARAEPVAAKRGKDR